MHLQFFTHIHGLARMLSYTHVMLYAIFMSPGQLIFATDYRLDYVHIHYVCVQMLHDNNSYVHDTAPVKHKIVSVIRTHSLVIRIHAL